MKRHKTYEFFPEVSESKKIYSEFPRFKWVFELIYSKAIPSSLESFYAMFGKDASNNYLEIARQR